MSTTVTLQIPADIAAQYPELVALIQESESMNVQERQYWINILPAMTPPQREQLQSILVNEKRQLAAIDRKYAAEMEEIGMQGSLIRTEQERRKRRATLAQKEEKAAQAEMQRKRDLLERIEES
ncbi:MAG: hypothetical protein WCX29_01330 [Candidatus Peribacteraceae bacterium]|jgi:hypothetical protein